MSEKTNVVTVAVKGIVMFPKYEDGVQKYAIRIDDVTANALDNLVRKQFGAMSLTYGEDEETGEKKEFTREELACMIREAAKEGRYKIGTHGFVVNKAVERQLEDNGFSVRWLYSETNLAVCDGVVISWDMRD